ncbi:MAG: polysaccharide export protein [Sphingomonadales bacterium]|nr:polysaccharide export protein [Sphingomonadales bacterium]
MAGYSNVRRLGGSAVAAVLAFGLVCSPAPAASNGTLLTASGLNAEIASGYRMAAGDKLRVTVFDEPSLTGNYQIGVDGELAMPLIEPVKAQGAIPGDLATAIGDRLKAGGYVLSPRVTVEIVEHRPFYILGEVKTPGEYPYTGDLTFEQAVARAGGFTPRASHRQIALKRQDWTEARRVKLDGPALKIAPGDTIVVRESLF